MYAVKENKSMPMCFQTTVILGDELLESQNIDNVIKNVEINNYEHLLIPLSHTLDYEGGNQHGDHHTLLHFDMKDPTWTLYNSRQADTSRSCLSDAKRMAERVNKVLLLKNYNASDLKKFKIRKDCPQQDEE